MILRGGLSGAQNAFDDIGFFFPMFLGGPAQLGGNLSDFGDAIFGFLIQFDAFPLRRELHARGNRHSGVSKMVRQALYERANRFRVCARGANTFAQFFQEKEELGQFLVRE